MGGKDFAAQSGSSAVMLFRTAKADSAEEDIPSTVEHPVTAEVLVEQPAVVVAEVLEHPTQEQQPAPEQPAPMPQKVLQIDTAAIPRSCYKALSALLDVLTTVNTYVPVRESSR